MFNNENDFENALIALLAAKGWEKDVLNYPDEEALIANWQKHLDKTNCHIDKLDVPLRTPVRHTTAVIRTAASAVQDSHMPDGR